MKDQEIRLLEEAYEKVWDIAGGMNLDCYPTHFEVVPPQIMYEFGSYGLPGRFSHWTHGKAYHQMKTMYDYGLSKIYELVINTNPCQAFLMDNNSVIQNVMVMAHVLGHCDFFKNNRWFRNTNRQMTDSASVNAERIRKYEFQHGPLEVERFLDAVLSIQEHIDPNLDQRPNASTRPDPKEDTGRPDRPFDDLLGQAVDPAAKKPGPKKFPADPEKDLLWFLANYSPTLEEWQRDIIFIVRSEMLYFVPQMQTKCINEGWASFWHLRIMREMDLPTSDYIEFANLHSGVLSPSPRRFNPYYVGLKVLEDIERRWDNPTEEEREQFKRPGGQGREKLFEVRELENDVSFLRNYLTKELVEDLDLYIYENHDDELVVVEMDWRKVRDILVHSMTNFGHPYITVQDGDYRGNRELLLKHHFEGRELDLDYAEKVLRHIQSLWGRKVHLETARPNGTRILLAFDGVDNTTMVL
ncbi:MAG: SpoVR family protein [Armatimonadota bacterium]|nr:SpoVR family protein [Armatimonadota bacterium]